MQQQAVPSGRAAAAPSRSAQPCLEPCSGRRRGARCGRVAAFEADPNAELEDEEDMEDIDLEEGTHVTFMPSAGEEG